MNLDHKKVLRNMMQRVDANHNAVLVFFEDAGVPLAEDGKISLQDVKNLHDTNYKVWSECMSIIYQDVEKYIAEHPEQFVAAAADGEQQQFDYLSLIGGILTGAGGVLIDNGTADELYLQEAEHQRQLAAQEAASSKRTLWIVLGILAVILIAAVFIFRKRF